MSKSNATENSFLKLVYQAVSWASLADNAASPATDIAVHLHTADPGEAGLTTTSECAYGSYAAHNVARTSSGWTVTNNTVNPVAAIPFPSCTSGTETASFFSTSLAGSTAILHSGAISPTIAISTGITPQLTTATTITED